MRKVISFFTAYIILFSIGWPITAPALLPLVHPSPLIVIPNSENRYSLINSVHFHPKRNIFCATYTQNNKVCLYKINQDGKCSLIQTLCNPSADLKQPQHAVFSPDGEKIVVANWADLSLHVYIKNEKGLFSKTPATKIYLPKALERSKPHGVAFSPCGNYLAVACGAASFFETGIALFKSQGKNLVCVNFLTQAQLSGTPKGICFTPDGTRLLVSFCEPDALRIFNIQNEQINPISEQTIAGINTGLSRPEDVKIAPDGTYCAVTNSDRNTVTFYRFNKDSNCIIDTTSIGSLQNPEAQLLFPHGIAFSVDRRYLAITQFGAVHVDQEGHVFWDSKLSSQEGTINIYRLKS